MDTMLLFWTVSHCMNCNWSLRGRQHMPLPLYKMQRHNKETRGQAWSQWNIRDVHLNLYDEQCASSWVITASQRSRRMILAKQQSACNRLCHQIAALWRFCPFRATQRLQRFGGNLPPFLQGPKLSLMQAAINAACRDQLLVSALLGYAVWRHYDDPVGIFNCC